MFTKAKPKVVSEDYEAMTEIIKRLCNLLGKNVGKTDTKSERKNRE